MKKVIHIILKVVLAVILIMPVLGTMGIFPPPTPDMYNTTEAYDFIMALTNAKYVMWIMSLVFALSFVLMLAKKMALVALLILPITINIVAFHMFLDGGLFTAGALIGNVLLLLNIYFLWQNRDRYKALF
ncbi:MAG: hypothetical protein KBB75_01005 [Candidatus Pacebacteria bacterium]|jgi:hypothetical protein|nr:hypothetical protein [Candidatus Paceibacterota bacterium]